MDELQFRRVNMLSNVIISRESSAAMEIFFKIERDSQSTIEVGPSRNMWMILMYQKGNCRLCV